MWTRWLLTKELLGTDSAQTFEVSDEVVAHTRQLLDRGQHAQCDWRSSFDTWAASKPDGKAFYDLMVNDELSPVSAELCRITLWNGR